MQEKESPTDSICQTEPTGGFHAAAHIYELRPGVAAYLPKYSTTSSSTVRVPAIGTCTCSAHLLKLPECLAACSCILESRMMMSCPMMPRSTNEGVSAAGRKTHRLLSNSVT
jgi:hypothetical protein